jgi:hypothetical protein
MKLTLSIKIVFASTILVIVLLTSFLGLLLSVTLIHEYASASSNATYTVEFKISPSESGVISCYNVKDTNPHYIDVPMNNEKYDFLAGSTLRCQANSSKGFSFSGWSGATSSDNNSITIKVLNDTNLVANFKENSIFAYIEFNAPIFFKEYGPTIAASAAGYFGATIGFKRYRSYRRNKRDAREERKAALSEFIENEYNEQKGDRQECIRRLNEIQADINHYFEKGELSEEDYQQLYNEIISFIKKL